MSTNDFSPTAASIPELEVGARHGGGAMHDHSGLGHFPSCGQHGWAWFFCFSKAFTRIFAGFGLAWLWLDLIWLDLVGCLGWIWVDFIRIWDGFGLDLLRF